MNNSFPCLKCGVNREMEIVERPEVVSIRGKEVNFLAHYTRCLTCGDEFESPAQLDENLNATKEAYAKLYESPSSESLIELRTWYGASQKAFGAILGFGELTMNSYERGNTPDPTNRLLLKLAADPSIFKVMYDINCSRIGAIQRRRIEGSEGFLKASSWNGISALARELTEIQREKIEDCARRNGNGLVQQIASYVASESFKDYSRLMNGARWTNSISQKVEITKCPDPILEQAS